MSAQSMILTSMNPVPMSSGDDYFAFPLTSAQRAMWPKGLTTIADPRYNGAFRMNLEGYVDAALLQESLREIAVRQESLRTTFRVLAAEAGVPEVQQVVFPVPDVLAEVIDLRSYSEPERALMLDTISTQEAQQPFDLSQGTPIRVKLLRIADTCSVLVLTVHQIICDGWSIGVFMEELAATYAAFALKQPSPLEPLSFQFGDYIAWQQEHALTGEVQAQLAYWKRKLSGCPRVKVTPDILPSTDSSQAGIVSQLLPRDLTDRLRQVSQAQNTTFFVVTMAACMATISRYTGEPDIALRTPLAGRTRVEFEPIIGQFVNQIAIRASVAGDTTFAVLIDRVRESLWEALANQEIPFDEVVRGLALKDNSPGEQPFNINFVCQKEYGRNGPSQFKFDGVTMTTMPSKSQGALYDLNFFLVEREVGWRLSLEYKTGLYTKDSAESLLRHLREMLCHVAEDANARLADLNLTATEALAKRVANFSAPSVEGPAEAWGAEPSGILEMPGSLAQERFWTLWQLDPANPSFHVPVVMRLAGRLSASLLERSFQVLIDRHESLRTTFRENDGEFLQVIHPAYKAALERVGLAGANEAVLASRIAAAIQQETLRPFDLTSLPLFRTVLCEVGEREHILIVTLHHILADAASAQVIQRELWTTYESLQLGRNVSLPPLTIQYGDFSVWQRENLHSEVMKTHLDFWLKSLAGDLKVLDFPTDRPPAYRPTSGGGVETLLLPEKLTKALKQLAQANGTTLYVVTLACFAAMLSRASEAEDLVIGSPVLNRREETEALIGPFAGPMAVRFSLAGNSTLRQLIESTRDRILEAIDHADLPFELLLSKLTLRTQNERRPLFQFYFLCQTAFVQSRELTGLAVTPQPSMSMGTPFEMQLAMIERGEGLRAELEYSADLFDQATVQRWLAYYAALLDTAVNHPDSRIDELPAPPFKSAPQQSASKGQREAKNIGQKASEKAYVAPRDLVEEMVAQVWESVLGVPSISVHTNFFDAGGSSLLILKMVPRINAAFDLVLPVPTIFKAPTIEMMANILREKNTIEKQVVLPLHPSGTRPPLFMIHSYHLYRALPAALGGDQPFYGIMELELSDRRPPYTLKDQVANYVQHIRQVQPKGPYYIAGFCFFGLVAFEVAAQLEALGEKVAFTGLIDTYCPEYWSRQHEADRPAVKAGGRSRPSTAAPLWHHLRKTKHLNLKNKLISHAGFIMEKLSNRRKSFVLETRVSIYTHYVSRQIQLPGWLKNPALLTRVGVRRHVPAKLRSDLYLFPAEDVPLGPDFDPTLGWGGMTTGNVHTLWIPGDHDDMFREKNIGAMAKTIRVAMDKARE